MAPAIRFPQSLNAAEIEAVLALATAVEARDGAPPLSDQVRGRLRSTAVGHVVGDDETADAVLTAYAQRDGESIELVAADDAALAAVLRAAGGLGGAPAEVWAHGNRSRVGVIAEKAGYQAVRTLHQLRSSLEPPPDVVALPAGVTVRAFVPGDDEDAWLAVNAAAFAEHREQGRLDRADLDAREAESWFDPAGFLLAEQAGQLIGFHWTKIHSGGLGEVYVLGVAPRAQGIGLAPALLTRGLRWLAERGCRTAMLYVDDDNPGALRLYERNNFYRYDADVQWRAERFT